mmetsp:Transcript_107343/g.149675  ORF Transcript_107343/g.149675 Transcript_107343/m.149675 type:complete len:148 (-) Transcript_107343:114-557(-)
MPTLSELKRRQAKTVREKWWEKGPTLPGEGCTPAQRRLADDKAHYTGVCRLLQATSLSRVGTHTSDFCTRPPLEASKLLLNRRYDELSIPRRAADFRTETDWRIQLRPFSPEREQRSQFASTPALPSLVKPRAPAMAATARGWTKAR